MPEVIRGGSAQPLVCVAGTRPEVIKLAPVFQAARLSLGPSGVAWVASGQHSDMADQMLDAFGITPDLRLDTQAGGSLPDLTANLVRALNDAFNELNPAAVVVQGDTTTAFVAALAAFYIDIPVAHVEAGLRSGDLRNPFPEEANRRLIAQIAQWHFAPTAAAAAHLAAENIGQRKITVTGNTVVDALQSLMQKPGWANAFPPPTSGRRRLLVTLHRREAWQGGLQAICKAVAAVVDRYPDVEVVLPVHRNPRVEEVVKAHLGGRSRIGLVDPLSYPEFQSALSQSYLVLTDSGGVQEEAPTYGVPVLVARRVTERSEAVDAGVAQLVGLDCDVIQGALMHLLEDTAAHQAMVAKTNPFGDGHAAHRIVQVLARTLAANSTISDRSRSFA